MCRSFCCNCSKFSGGRRESGHCSAIRESLQSWCSAGGSHIHIGGIEAVKNIVTSLPLVSQSLR